MVESNFLLSLSGNARPFVHTSMVIGVAKWGDRSQSRNSWIPRLEEFGEVLGFSLTIGNREEDGDVVYAGFGYVQRGTQWITH